MKSLLSFGLLALIAGLSNGQSVSPIQCPTGWQSWTNYCYLFVNTTRASWEAADRECHDKQGSLLRIETLDEFTFIRKAQQLYPSDDYWTALNNLGGVGSNANASTTFMWGNDEYPLDSVVKSNWDKEPNNSPSLDCVMMSIQATLSVGDCNERHAYVCEMQKPSSGCPDQTWLLGYAGNYCYLISNATDWSQTLNWDAARKMCESKSANGNTAYLVKIVSTDVQNFLFDFIPQSYYGRQQFWTGLNDRNTEGSFQWSDGTTYNNNSFAGKWRQEPNDLAGTEHCGALLPNAKFNDADCSDTKNYICRQGLPSANSLAMNLGCGTWVRAGRSCVSVYTSPLRNWTDARQYCQTQGGDLLKFDTATDADWLIMQAINGYTLKGTSGFWIGLNDQAQESTFVWTDNTEPHGDILHWTKEPNRLVNYGANCASISSFARFLDEDCDHDYAVAGCEEAASSNGGCGPGWVAYNNRCYFFDANNWHMKSEAVNICKQKSLSGAATLLTFNSMDELTWFTNNVPGGPTGGKLFWTTLISTGGMDWMWDAVYMDVTLLNQIVQWDSEPNNWGGNEDCVEIIQAGTLNDQTCANVNGFICQKYLNLPPITTINPAGHPDIFAGTGSGASSYGGSAVIMCVLVALLGKMLI